MTPKRLIENHLILNEENFLFQRHLHCVKNADIEEVVDFEYKKGKENDGESWDDEVICTDIVVFYAEHFFF